MMFYIRDFLEGYKALLFFDTCGQVRLSSKNHTEHPRANAPHNRKPQIKIALGNFRPN